jgi:hypothetical protein
MPLLVKVAKPPPIGRVFVELMAEAADEADKTLERSGSEKSTMRGNKNRDSRRASLRRVAVSLHQNVVNDVEDAV